jgi:hypothetical protein
MGFLSSPSFANTASKSNQLHLVNPTISVDREEQPQNPKITSLRALRLHNITRNYQDKNALPQSHKSTYLEKSLSVKSSQQSKTAKVRQWELIYH